MLSKNAQARATKDQSVTRLITRSKNERTKFPQYSRVHETSERARYAMTFKKNQKTSGTDTKSTTSSMVLNTSSLTFLTKFRQVLSLYTGTEKTQVNRGFMTYTQAQLMVTNKVLNPTMSLTLYTNSITGLLFNNNARRLGYTTSTSNAYTPRNDSVHPQEASRTNMSTHKIMSNVLTSTSQSGYNLPLLNN